MNDFKVIVAGGRDFNNYELLSRVIFAMSDVEYADKEVSIVSGLARGADQLGVQFAHEYGVTLHKFPANWDLHGKSAGFKRNIQMGNFADALLAFWDGKSKGTQQMIEFMYDAGKPVTVIKY